MPEIFLIFIIIRVLNACSLEPNCLTELSKKLHHYWYSVPRICETCLFDIWESIWYQQKNSSFFETILQYALTHLFNVAADLLNKMSNWFINSKLVREYCSHISMLLSIKFPYMPQCWNILKSLKASDRILFV